MHVKSEILQSGRREHSADFIWQNYLEPSKGGLMVAVAVGCKPKMNTRKFWMIQAGPQKRTFDGIGGKESCLMTHARGTTCPHKKRTEDSLERESSLMQHSVEFLISPLSGFAHGQPLLHCLLALKSSGREQPVTWKLIILGEFFGAEMWLGVTPASVTNMPNKCLAGPFTLLFYP